MSNKLKSDDNLFFLSDNISFYENFDCDNIFHLSQSIESMTNFIKEINFEKKFEEISPVNHPENEEIKKSDHPSLKNFDFSPINNEKNSQRNEVFQQTNNSNILIEEISENDDFSKKIQKKIKDDKHFYDEISYKINNKINNKFSTDEMNNSINKEKSQKKFNIFSISDLVNNSKQSEKIFNKDGSTLEKEKENVILLSQRSNKIAELENKRRIQQKKISDFGIDKRKENRSIKSKKKIENIKEKNIKMDQLLKENKQKITSSNPSIFSITSDKKKINQNIEKTSDIIISCSSEKNISHLDFMSLLTRNMKNSEIFLLDNEYFEFKKELKVIRKMLLENEFNLKDKFKEFKDLIKNYANDKINSILFFYSVILNFILQSLEKKKLKIMLNKKFKSEKFNPNIIINDGEITDISINKENSAIFRSPSSSKNPQMKNYIISITKRNKKTDFACKSEKEKENTKYENITHNYKYKVQNSQKNFKDLIRNGNLSKSNKENNIYLNQNYNSKNLMQINNHLLFEKKKNSDDENEEYVSFSKCLELNEEDKLLKQKKTKSDTFDKEQQSSDQKENNYIHRRKRVLIDRIKNIEKNKNENLNISFNNNENKCKKNPINLEKEFNFSLDLTEEKKLSQEDLYFSQNCKNKIAEKSLFQSYEKGTKKRRTSNNYKEKLNPSGSHEKFKIVMRNENDNPQKPKNLLNKKLNIFYGKSLPNNCYNPEYTRINSHTNINKVKNYNNDIKVKIIHNDIKNQESNAENIRYIGTGTQHHNFPNPNIDFRNFHNSNILDPHIFIPTLTSNHNNFPIHEQQKYHNLFQKNQKFPHNIIPMTTSYHQNIINHSFIQPQKINFNIDKINSVNFNSKTNISKEEICINSIKKENYNSKILKNPPSNNYPNSYFNSEYKLREENKFKEPKNSKEKLIGRKEINKNYKESKSDLYILNLNKNQKIFANNKNDYLGRKRTNENIENNHNQKM